jgi:hypothetical protein
MPISTAMKAATGAPLPGIGAEAATRRPLPRLASGYSCSSARAMLVNSPCACPMETPGLRRAPITSHTPSRLVRIDPERRGDSSPTIVIGTHMSVVSTVVP